MLEELPRERRPFLQLVEQPHIHVDPGTYRAVLVQLFVAGCLIQQRKARRIPNIFVPIMISRLLRMIFGSWQMSYCIISQAAVLSAVVNDLHRQSFSRLTEGRS